MRFPHIAVAVTPFNRPLRKALQQIREWPVSGVQLQVDRDLSFDEMTETGRRQLLYELNERDLKISSLHLSVQHRLGEFEGLDARVDRIKRALQLAFQLKAPSVTFRMGRIPDDTNSPEYETLLGVLNDLAQHANYAGSIPSLIPAGDSPERLAELVNKVKSGPLGICLDPSVAVIAGQSPPAVLRALLTTVNHVLIRDAVRDIDGTVTEVPVGRGEVSWDELLSVLNEAEFAGWMTITRTQGDDKVGDMARAVRFVHNVLAE